MSMKRELLSEGVNILKPYLYVKTPWYLQGTDFGDIFTSYLLHFLIFNLDRNLPFTSLPTPTPPLFTL